MDEDLRDFLEEAKEINASLSRDSKELRLRRDEGRVRRELIARIFRRVHTLKGAAATVELENTSTLAHRMESVLDAVRVGNLAVSDEVLDTVDDGLELIRASVDTASSEGGTPLDPTQWIKQTESLLDRSFSQTNLANSEQNLERLPAAIRASLTRPETHRLCEAIEDGAGLYVVSVDFDLHSFDENLRKVRDVLTDEGEIISTMPGDIVPERMAFRMLYATEIAREALLSRLGAFGSVSCDELISAETQDDEISAAPYIGYQDASVSISHTLSRAVKAGKSAARAIGKDIDFVTKGEDVEASKQTVNAISESLLHLVRNAVDHGIESQTERTSLGKSERGHISIHATGEDGVLRITIEDDGRGIDLDSVAQRARERGAIIDLESFTDNDALRLIFKPGFSTTGKLTMISGRGMGLDVVRSAVKATRGEIKVRSKQGEGTTFELLIPTGGAEAK